MKKKLAVAAALSLFSTLAAAGLTQPADTVVTINADGSGLAQGDMVTARFSPNAVQFIGCGLRTFDDGAGGAFQTGFCQAGDAAGVRFTCFTDNVGLLDAMRATGDFSFITFAWNEFGECTRIGFSTQSFYIPQFTKK